MERRRVRGGASWEEGVVDFALRSWLGVRVCGGVVFVESGGNRA